MIPPRGRWLALAWLSALACVTRLDDALRSDPLQAPPAADTVPSSPRPQGADVAEVPRKVPAWPADLVARACTVSPRSSAELGAEILRARGGTTLCLTPGESYPGTFTVPARADNDTGWVVLRTAPSVAPLLPGERLTPTVATQLAKLVGPGTEVGSVLRFGMRARKWLVESVEVTADSSGTQGPVALIVIGTNGERTIADLPTDIVLSHVFVHGAERQHVRRAIAANGGAMTLVDSWCENIHARGFDSQCWATWGGAGPILIENNHLSAGSENIVFGGADPSVSNLVPTDVTIRRNYLFKPTAWINQGWNVKNLLESKAAARVLVEHNVFDGQWHDQAAGHAAVVLKSTSQDGRCPSCSTSDWTIRGNLFRNVATPFSLGGRADQHVTGRTDSTNRRFSIVENWIEPTQVEPFTAPNRGAIIFVAENDEVEFRRNVMEGSQGVVAGAIFDITAGTYAARNMAFSSNIWPRGEYGFFTSGVSEGLRAWQAGASGKSSWANNSLLGNSAAEYPVGTTWHPTLSQALASGAGFPRATIDSLVRGVVVPR